MRILLIVIGVLVFRLAYSQERLLWNTYFVEDSTESDGWKSFYRHTSIYPQIAKRRTDMKKDTVDYTHTNLFSIFPVADLVGGITENRLDLRTGVGVGIEYAPVKGLYMQLGYAGGLANRDAIIYSGGAYPTAFFRFQNQGFTTYQYHDLRGRISYSPNKFFNFQVGLDNNKFGEGDRSLLLDGYGTPYPFVSLRLRVWRAEYVILHQLLRERDLAGGFFRKHAATHYLSLNLFKGFNFSFFESVIYSGKAGSQSRPFEWEYLNPFILYRPVEYGLGSSDKVQIGIQLSQKIYPSLQVYGQLMIDDFLLKEIMAANGWWANKFAAQLGVKGRNVFGIKGLRYLTEVNFARPYTYTHGTTGQSFTHQGTVLAHPYGANFAEWNTRLRYVGERWDFNVDVVYALRGSDFSDSISWGGDILQSYNNRPGEYGFYIGNGDKYNWTKVQLTTGYMVVPKWRMRAFVTVEYLGKSHGGKLRSYLGGFWGLRTELWNDPRNY